MEYNHFNYCPLTEKNEDIIDCIENIDVADEFIPNRFKTKDNWKEICKNCPIHKELFNDNQE